MRYELTKEYTDKEFEKLWREQYPDGHRVQLDYHYEWYKKMRCSDTKQESKNGKDSCNEGNG